MLSYLSKIPGIGGTIKSTADDFIVEEILQDGTVLEINKKLELPSEGGQFTHFILQKKDWSTSSAFYEIAKRLGVGQKRLSFAGTKDKTAISTQRASAFNIPKEHLLNLKIKDIQINGAWSGKDKVRLGQLLGNRFLIRARGKSENSKSVVNKIALEIDSKFPNYFGEQRFGSTRKNTHLIGLQLLKERYDKAVNIFLCDTRGEENQQAREARKDLEETGDYKQALRNFPKYLRLERKVVAYLEKYPGNYANALRRLPRPILLLFVHAIQSHIFNQLLSQRISEKNLELEKGEYYCGDTLGFPDLKKTEAEGWIVGKIIGYMTQTNEREDSMLEKLELRKEQFKLPSMPEISSKGTYRTLLAPLKDFSFDNEFGFSLPAGSYATVALREFLDEKR